MAELLVTRMGERGDGLAEGRAFPRTLPGEVISKTGAVLKPSPDRVDPFCPVFDICGGCKTQHWRVEPYLAWKVSLLTEALAAKGLKTEVKPLIDAHGEGRQRVALHVRKVDDGWRAGFMAAGTHNLVPIDECPILEPKLKSAPQLAAQLGPIFGNADVWVTLADNGLDMAVKAERKIADRAMSQFAPFMQRNNIVRIAVNGETVAQVTPPLVNIGKAQVPLPVGSFLQATRRGEEVLSALVLELARKARKIADLFCGVGPFALRLAENATVHSFDSDKAAISALQQALRNTQGLKPVKAEARDLFRNPLTPMELNEFDLVVLDPPRAGAEAQVKALAKSRVKRIAYVSCDPQSFARDAAILVGAGYTLGQVTPVDQFKYSPHLELAAGFTRR